MKGLYVGVVTLLAGAGVVPTRQHLKTENGCSTSLRSTSVGSVPTRSTQITRWRQAAGPIPIGVQVFSLPVPIYRVIGIAVLADALSVPAVFAFLGSLKCKDLLMPKPSA